MTVEVGIYFLVCSKMVASVPFPRTTLYIFALILLPYANGKLAVLNEVTIKTGFGTVTGTIEKVTSTVTGSSTTTVEETSYLAFRGIPYAERPQRWQESVVKQPLAGEFKATKEGHPCPQWGNVNGAPSMLGDEDCLYASIFIPVVPNNPCPVLKFMVFFHGGGFLVNAEMNKLPIPLLHHKNAIIVLFNYRLSVFGYLSTGTTHLPGNYAFFDQITMLKWIQTYGKDFGGDINDVTVFGSSIGSVSIHYLLLSEQAKGLFHRAIMESGSALCERSLVSNPLEICKKIATQLQCQTTNNDAMIACLQKKTTLEIMTAAKALSKSWILPSVLGPVLDSTSRPEGRQFLPNYPETSLVANKVTVMLGNTANEGLTAFVKLAKGYSKEELSNETFVRSNILPNFLDLIMRERKPSINRETFIRNLTDNVLAFYQSNFTADDIIETLVAILGDIWIHTCHRATVQQLCLNSVPRVYNYLFSHRDRGVSPSNLISDIKGLEQKGIQHEILQSGVSHTEEILYLLPRIKDILQGEALAFGHAKRNRQMTDLLSKLWTDFATTSVTRSMEGSSWVEACSSVDFPANVIDLDRRGRVNNFRARETEFWGRIHLETLLQSS